MVSSTIDFYSKNKGKKQLVEPHPSIHHSVQFSSSQFKLSEVENTKAIAAVLNKKFNSEVKSLTKIEILDHGDIRPIYLENLRPEKFEYLILRPKMGKTGVPVVKFWEALLYRQSSQFMIDHVDSEINPRYCGMI
jgi:glutathione peroxidase-family protein